MAYLKLYIGSDNTLELLGLKNTTSGAFVADATVEATITDSDGTAITGETWPVTLDHVADDPEAGNYRANLSEDLVIVEGEKYTATVTATSGDDVRTFKKQLKAVYD